MVHLTGSLRWHLFEQSLVRQGPCTRRPSDGIVVATRRHTEQSTYHSHGIGSAAVLDHPLLHFRSLAMNTAASRKKSRSFLARASSRRSATSSSSRAFPWLGNALGLVLLAPATQHLHAAPELLGNLAFVHAGLQRQLNRLLFELFGKPSSFARDTPLGSLSTLFNVSERSGQTPPGFGHQGNQPRDDKSAGLPIWTTAGRRKGGAQGCAPSIPSARR